MNNDDEEVGKTSAANNMLRRLWWGGIPFGALALAWIVLVRLFEIRPVFLPPLELMPDVVWRMFLQEAILRDVAISCFRILVGFLAAAAIATPLGILMGYDSRMNQIFAPIIGFFRYIPVPVFIPLCILWFGSGNLEKMVVIFLGAWFQLTLLIQDAASSVRRDYYEAATMLGAPRHALVLRVLWPASLPQIFDGYRVTIGWAWTYLIVAEIVGANTGLGYYIIKAQRYLQIPQIFAAIALIGVLGMATDLLMGKIHRSIFPWAERSRGFLA